MATGKYPVAGLEARNSTVMTVKRKDSWNMLSTIDQQPSSD